jgi:hypothetical protein
MSDTKKIIVFMLYFLIFAAIKDLTSEIDKVTENITPEEKNQNPRSHTVLDFLKKYNNMTATIIAFLITLFVLCIPVSYIFILLSVLEVFIIFIICSIIRLLQIIKVIKIRSHFVTSKFNFNSYILKKYMLCPRVLVICFFIAILLVILKRLTNFTNQGFYWGAGQNTNSSNTTDGPKTEGERGQRTEL